MSGSHSRAKGARGERELAAYLRSLGVEARRGVQYAGGPDSPDVVHSLPGVHLECKRTERLSVYAALDQATADAPADCVPVVAHRRNRREWVAILPLRDLVALLRNAWEVAGRERDEARAERDRLRERVAELRRVEADWDWHDARPCPGYQHCDVHCPDEAEDNTASRADL